MELLTPTADLDAFFDRLASSEYPLLMLDYDGTLAPFRRERDEAIPYPGVRERLAKFVASPKTRVIIISGRWIEDLLPLLGLEKVPEVWGCHGAERLDRDGTHSPVSLSPPAAKGLSEAEQWARDEDLLGFLEKKPISVAFHWRELDAEAQAKLRDRVRSHWESRAESFELVLHEFDGGLELKAAGIDKGQVVRTVLADLPREYTAAYLGDDLTDEDAFRALEGHGLRVLVRKEKRATAADVHLVPPEELLAFLDRWLHVTGD